MLQLDHSCAGHCLRVRLASGLSDPGLGGWAGMSSRAFPRVGKDSEHPGLLERLRQMEGNENWGTLVGISAVRKCHSWGGGGCPKPPSILKNHSPPTPNHFVMLCDHFISTPWQFKFPGYVPPRAYLGRIAVEVYLIITSWLQAKAGLVNTFIKPGEPSRSLQSTKSVLHKTHVKCTPTTPLLKQMWGI